MLPPQSTTTKFQWCCPPPQMMPPLSYISPPSCQWPKWCLALLRPWYIFFIVFVNFLFTNANNLSTTANDAAYLQMMLLTSILHLHQLGSNEFIWTTNGSTNLVEMSLRINKLFSPLAIWVLRTNTGSPFLLMEKWRSLVTVTHYVKKYHQRFALHITGGFWNTQWTWFKP